MGFDAHKNFSYSTVATAPSPATSGTSLVVQSGDGAKFPAVPFNATVWPAGVQPTSDVAEIVRVTNRSTDTLTITRAQESSSARSIGVGDQIAATITAKTLTDVEAAAGLLHTTASSGSSLTVDYSTANNWDITLTANCTFTLSGATSGDPDTLTLLLRQDGTGSHTVTWPGSVTWLSGSAPTLHTAASAVDIIQLFSVDGGTTWFGAQVNSTAVGSWTTYDCAPTGFSGTPTQTCSRYTVIGSTCIVYLNVSGTSNASTFTLQLPFNTKQASLAFAAEGLNSGANPTSPFLATTGASATKTLTIFRDWAAGTGFTSSGTKSVQVTVTYEI